MSYYRHQSSIGGFTLIELMITIALLAILIALAIPAYSDYTIRSKIAECINGAAIAKASISEHRQSLSAWPPTLEEAGLEVAGISHYCTALNNCQSATRAFTVDINEADLGSSLAEDSLLPVLTPTERASQVIDWNCSRGIMTAEFLKYLPASCRGS